jgi:hypothetical protein
LERNFVNGPDSSAHLGLIATVLSHNFFGALQVAPMMVKLAALHRAAAKGIPEFRLDYLRIRTRFQCRASRNQLPFPIPSLSRPGHAAMVT